MYADRMNPVRRATYRVFTNTRTFNDVINIGGYNGKGNPVCRR